MDLMSNSIKGDFNNINYENDYNYEANLLELHNYIDRFVYGNWKYKNFSFMTKDLILEIEEEDDFYDDNLFYKDIVYI